jgi:hypothetical protein
VRNSLLIVAATLALSWFAACDDGSPSLGVADTQDGVSLPDSGRDAEADAVEDVEGDGVADAISDAAVDSVEDAVPDAVSDGGPDAISDAAADVAHDTAADGISDAVSDAGPDAPLDGGPDAVSDAGPDAVVDAGPDAISDVVTDVVADVVADTSVGVDGGPDADAAPACTDECPSKGATECASGGVATCGDFDADSCLEWSPPSPCEQGEACAGGVCEAVTGSASCADLNSCVSDCEDAACQTACYQAGTAAAQFALSRMLTCFSASECADDACIYNRCGPEVAACLYEETGAATCGQVSACAAACPAGDKACGVGCVESASLVAQAAWVSFAGCLSAACQPGDGACANTATSVGGACAVATAACYDPDGAGDDCMGLTDCATACDGDEGCLASCYAAASSVGLAEYSALQICAGTSGCSNLGCLGATCGYEWAQCAAPGVGTGGCAAIGGCASSCQEGLGSECVASCLGQGSLTAQSQFFAAYFCILAACPTQTSACSAQAAAGVCAPAVGACQGDLP